MSDESENYIGRVWRSIVDRSLINWVGSFVRENASRQA